MGKPTVLAAGLGLGAILILWSDKPPHPAAAPKPVTRTVYVHQTVTKVIQVAGHTGLPPWAWVVIAVVALGALCGLTLGRNSS
jgi:hypothetical protein